MGILSKMLYLETTITTTTTSRKQEFVQHDQIFIFNSEEEKKVVCFYLGNCFIKFSHDQIRTVIKHLQNLIGDSE